METLSTLIEESRVEKKTKGESKHYVPFSNAEWAKLEAQAGRELEPKDLKLMLVNIFSGKLTVSKPKPVST